MLNQLEGINNNSLTLCIITLFLGFVNSITLNNVAAVATILAALSTAAYNIWRVIKEARSRNPTP